MIRGFRKYLCKGKKKSCCQGGWSSQKQRLTNQVADDGICVLPLGGLGRLISSGNTFFFGLIDIGPQEGKTSVITHNKLGAAPDM